MISCHIPDFLLWLLRGGGSLIISMLGSHSHTTHYLALLLIVVDTWVWTGHIHSRYSVYQKWNYPVQCACQKLYMSPLHYIYILVSSISFHRKSAKRSSWCSFYIWTYIVFCSISVAEPHILLFRRALPTKRGWCLFQLRVSDPSHFTRQPFHGRLVATLLLSRVLHVPNTVMWLPQTICAATCWQLCTSHLFKHHFISRQQLVGHATYIW